MKSKVLVLKVVLASCMFATCSKSKDAITIAGAATWRASGRKIQAAPENSSAQWKATGGKIKTANDNTGAVL